MDNGSELRIGDWLERSGYALELRVARALTKVGCGVFQHVPYSDPLERKQREADVIGYFSGFLDKLRTFAIVLAIECKSSRKHPWLAFYPAQERRGSGGVRNVAIPFASKPELIDQAQKVWGDSFPFKGQRRGTAIVTAHAGTEDDERNSLNPAGRATRQALSAAFGLGPTYKPRLDAEDAVTLILPVVVTSAPLRTCTLGPDGDVQIVPTEYVQVAAQQEGYAEQSIVHVMSENYLSSEFAPAARRLAAKAFPDVWAD